MFSDLQNKLNTLLWETRLSSLNRAQAFVIQAMRILYGAGRDIGGGLPSLRAMSLVYTTLISLVPLLAVSFSVLKGFGVHNQLEPALISVLEPLGDKGAELSGKIITFVDQVKVGVLGSVGLAVLIFTVLSLVKKIESAFNYTWRITTTRSLTQRFSNYLSVILLGPLLLFAAAGLTTSFNSSTVIDTVRSIEPFGTILVFLGEVTPFFLTAITFTFVYTLIPNTRVKLGSAFYGAVAATLLWKLSGQVFSSFIVNSTNYTAIYSGFAILIIFMLWIYVNWLIVLAGASIAYYHQYPDRISNQSQIIRLSCRLREKLALTIMQLIGRSFHNNDKAWTIRALEKETRISEPALMLVISALISDKLLTTTGQDNKQFIPCQSLENISLKMILDSARSAEEGPNLRPQDVDTVASIDEKIEQIDTAISTALKDTSLKDLL